MELMSLEEEKETQVFRLSPMFSKNVSIYKSGREPSPEPNRVGTMVSDSLPP